MLVGTGPAARIPAEAHSTPTRLPAREAAELRQTEFDSVGSVFLFALETILSPARFSIPVVSSLLLPYRALAVEVALAHSEQ
jgi:hypothetical protein